MARTYKKLPASVARDPEHTAKVLTTFMEEVDEDLDNPIIHGDQSADSMIVGGNLSGYVTATGSTKPRLLRDRFANVANVMDFGAVGDGVTADNEAFQAAIDLAESQSPVGAVYIPRGNFFIDHNTAPLRIKTAGLEIFGDGDGSKVTAYPTMAFQIAPEMAALPIVAGLPSAQTNEFGIDFWQRTGDTFYLQLSDVMTPGLLNGLSAFCVQGWYKPLNMLDAGTLIYSRGRLHSSRAVDEAFSIVVGADNLVCSMKISGVDYTCNSPLGVMSANNTYHIALTFDGSNIRLFIDGVLQTTTAAAGTITQAKWERVIMGTSLLDCWSSEVIAGGPRGVMSHWEVANASRHVAAFTTPTSMTFDGSSKATIRIQDSSWYTDAALRLYAPGFPWIPVYQEYFGTGAVGETRLHDFFIQNSSYGIFAAANTRAYYDRLTLKGASQYGMMLYDNNYFSHVSRCEIQGVRCPFIAAAASGVMTVSDCKLHGGLVNGVCVGSGQKFDHVFFEGESDTIVNCIVDARGGSIAGYQFDYCVFADEGGSAGLIACLIADDCHSLACYQTAFNMSHADDELHLLLDAETQLKGFPVTLDTCVFPGATPLSGNNIEIFSTTAVWGKGQIRVKGYQTGVAGRLICSVPDKMLIEGRDAYEYEGYIDIADAATTGAVAFGTDEPDTTYHIQLTAGHQVGAPAAGSTRAYYTARATTGFTVNLEVAPGAGTTVRVHWRIQR